MREWISLFEGKIILYHGTPRENRDEIMKHGLLRSKSDTAQLAREYGEPDWESAGGIFFSTKPPEEDERFDCWAVDVTGLNLERDETTDHDHLDEEWWVTYTDAVIEPSRLKLVQR